MTDAAINLIVKFEAAELCPAFAQSLGSNRCVAGMRNTPTWGDIVALMSCPKQRAE